MDSIGKSVERQRRLWLYEPDFAPGLSTSRTEAANERAASQGGIRKSSRKQGQGQQSDRDGKTSPVTGQHERASERERMLASGDDVERQSCDPESEVRTRWRPPAQSVAAKRYCQGRLAK